MILIFLKIPIQDYLNKLKLKQTVDIKELKTFMKIVKRLKKASKLHPLTKEEKIENKRMSKERIFIEHINSHIKRFKILSTRYRNKRKKHGLRMSLICGVYNYELISYRTGLLNKIIRCYMYSFLINNIFILEK